ncbi:MAG TPA: NAD(P)H-hydrate dehydratase [Burkholderiaceae bacterium]|nr:NAD(P)H-hydrate dehydratase [Burkholderiaceae bacterium]
MIKISGHESRVPLHRSDATRAIEVEAARQLAPHTLMARAARATAQLAKAIAPHAKSVWVACGPGNNGGDGLLTAALLAPWLAVKGGELAVTWFGDEARLPGDAKWALALARTAGVKFSPPPTSRCDLVIDALLGIGASKRHESAVSPDDGLQAALKSFRSKGDILLCVDTPSDLNADTGSLLIAQASKNKSADRVYTLTFLTIKPGLFTGHGRDAAGEVWFDDLGCTPVPAVPDAVAQLVCSASAADPSSWQPTSQEIHRTAVSTASVHATHKGDFGDVWVVGGQGMSHAGHAMTGALLLAARAALNAGAGRVFAIPLDQSDPISVDTAAPELMFRHVDSLNSPAPLPGGAWVCGCGGGTAVCEMLPTLLQHAPMLVLDADALNAIAIDPALQQRLVSRQAAAQCTVLTPHPLEAARLLACTTVQVQQDRLHAAQSIADRYQVICVLKGSGTVVAAPHLLPTINFSGNAKLSTAGTGDVLAGLIGVKLAPLSTRTQADAHAVPPDADRCMSQWEQVFDGVCHAVWLHGHQADTWPTDRCLTANQLALSLSKNIR